jgi:hypothetical protein
MWAVTISGTSSAPITFMSYPGEWAKIDGSAFTADHVLLISGGYLTFRDLEVMNSGYKPGPYPSACNPSDPYNPTHIGPRTNCETGSLNNYYGRGTGFNVAGPGIKIINNIIHDTGQGVYAGIAAPDLEVTGNVIYFNGWNGPDRGHGHGIYLQNQTGQKLIRYNIIFGNYGYGIQAYGTSNTYLKNIVIDGNVMFGNGAPATNGLQPGLLLGGGAPVVNSRVTNNHVYRDLSNPSGHNVEIGYPILQSVLNSDVVVTGNQFISGGPTLDITSFQKLTFTNNRVIGNKELFWWNTSNQATAYRSNATVNNNAYVFVRGANSAQPFRILVDNTTTFFGNLSGWQSALGYDMASTYTEALPSKTDVFVRPNPSAVGRANIIVYNWTSAGAASADVSSVLKAGDSYEIRNATNYLAGPIATGTYSGGAIQIPLSARSVAIPVGLSTAPQVAGSGLGVYVLIKK